MSRPCSAAAALVFLALGFFSCSLISFEEFNAEPSVSESQNYYANEFISVFFSMEPDRAAAESLAALKENGSAVEAEFFWREKSCLLKAKGGFKKGRKYSFSLDGSLPLQDGRVYSVGIFREFIFGSEADSFRMTKAQEPETNQGKRAPLALEFNKAVEPASFEREFSITPQTETQKKYSDDFCRVEIIPSDKWKANEFYSWKLQSPVSADGVQLCKSCSGSFLPLKKEAAPKAICACPVSEDGIFYEEKGLDGIWERGAIGIIFDSDMDFESVKKAASLSPGVEGIWNKKDSRRFAFTPLENYKIACEYLLEISDSAEDEFGIRAAEARHFYFTTQADFIAARAFCAAKKDGKTAEARELEAGGQNCIEILDGSPLIVVLKFSKALDKKSVSLIRNAISMQAVFPQSAAAPNLDYIRPSADGFEILTEWSGFDFCSEGEQVVYKLKVNGGANFIFDQYGEYLKEDECFYLSIKKS